MNNKLLTASTKTITPPPSVFIVEDEMVVSLDIQKHTQEYGYSIAGAEVSGEDAIREIEREKPDLVLMDIMLKGQMDGIQAAKVIKNKWNIPVVFLTAYADEQTLHNAKIAEPKGYILKPFDPLELHATLQIALQQNLSQDTLRSRQHEYEDEMEAVPDWPLSSEGVNATKPSVEDLLRRIPPFNSLDSETIKKIAPTLHSKNVKAGDFLVYEGDEDYRCFILAEGRMVLVKSSLSGKELIVDILPAGSTYGLEQLSNSQPHSVSARAQVDSLILSIPQAALQNVLSKNIELYQFFTKDLTDRLNKSLEHARGLAHDSVELRIASALVALVPRFSQEDNGHNKRKPVVEMTRQELADITGTTPETAIRVTKDMERKGLLDLSEPVRIVILDIDGLREIFE